MPTLWQKSMISLARSERAKRVAHRVGGRSPLAKRFLGGQSPQEAVETARRLRDELGITASLFYLGEYVADPALVAANVQGSIAVAEMLGATDLDVHVSIDPTAIGYLAGEELGRQHAERIARVIARQPGDRRNYLMLDMEDLGQLEPTLRLHAHLAGTRLPAAVTLQSRLRRTARDLRELVEQPTAVRLVKGAFPLGPEHDHTGRAAISASYLALAEMMLSKAARDAGFYPVFGTHDDALAEQLIQSAHRNGWEPEQYEFEMLYGVRPDWQQALRARGIQVRAYVPFGEDWWPYAVRRVGENPRNARLMARAVAGGSYRWPRD